MNSNLTNEKIFSIFVSKVIATTGGDVTTAYFTGANFAKNNLVQADSLEVLLMAVSKNIPAACTITASYYSKNNILLGTELQTLAAITEGNNLNTVFSSAYIAIAEYFTLSVVLKQAVANAYTATCEVTTKKKINDEYSLITEKTSLVDADLGLGFDSANNFSKIKTTWTNIKAFLKTYFDTIYNYFPLTSQSPPISETRATATYSGAANAGFTLYSKILGVAGNYIAYKITTAADDNLAIALSGVGTSGDPYVIDIRLANTTPAKNTATLVIAAIIADVLGAGTLVLPVLTGTGAGVVATQAQASLSGGLNGTTGFLGQVLFDSSGNRWEMVYSVSNCYYWSPQLDCFPVANTDYVVCWSSELNRIIYKRLYTGTTAVSTLTSFADGVGILSQLVDTTLTLIRADGIILNGHYTSATNYTFSNWLAGNLRLTHPNDAQYVSRPYRIKMKFTKLV